MIYGKIFEMIELFQEYILLFFLGLAGFFAWLFLRVPERFFVGGQRVFYILFGIFILLSISLVGTGCQYYVICGAPESVMFLDPVIAQSFSTFFLLLALPAMILVSLTRLVQRRNTWWYSYYAYAFFLLGCVIFVLNFTGCSLAIRGYVIPDYVNTYLALEYINHMALVVGLLSYAAASLFFVYSVKENSRFKYLAFLLPLIIPIILIVIGVFYFINNFYLVMYMVGVLVLLALLQFLFTKRRIHLFVLLTLFLVIAMWQVQKVTAEMISSTPTLNSGEQCSDYTKY